MKGLEGDHKGLEGDHKGLEGDQHLLDLLDEMIRGDLGDQELRKVCSYIYVIGFRRSKHKYKRPSAADISRWGG